MRKCMLMLVFLTGCVDILPCPPIAIDADADSWTGEFRETSAAIFGSGKTECEENGDVYAGDDCDDTDPNVHPGALEICNDGIDQDCDGSIDETSETDPCVDFTDEDMTTTYTCSPEYATLSATSSLGSCGEDTTVNVTITTWTYGCESGDPTESLRFEEELGAAEPCHASLETTFLSEPYLASGEDRADWLSVQLWGDAWWAVVTIPVAAYDDYCASGAECSVEAFGNSQVFVETYYETGDDTAADTGA